MFEESKDSAPRLRLSERQKKPTKPFDPSVLAMRRTKPFDPPVLAMRRRTEYPVLVTKPICCYCKKIGRAEVLVNCRSCFSAIHLTCLQSICEYFGENEEQTWKCDNCQSCSICKKGIINGKPPLKCYICFTYYHSLCLGTVERIKTVKKNRFRCHICEEKTETTKTDLKKTSTVVRSNTLVIRRSSRAKSVSYDNNESDFFGFNNSEIGQSTKIMKRPRSPAELHSPQRNLSDNVHGIDHETSIPDASKWSTNEVFEYFNRKFPKHAHAFKEEEIDGESLYLLDREDVIRGLKIKIGPAVKIFDHILKLKNKSSV